MKIKKSDLMQINAMLDDVYDYISCSLDFIDDDQIDYVRTLLDDIFKTQTKLKETMK